MKKYLGTMISCISLSLALLLFFSCATRKPQNLSDFESAPMYGMVYDYENQACADTLIIINEERETRSDINGRFIITDLLRGNHQITAKKEGYETISFSLYFTNRSQVLYIRMISFYQLLKNIENEIEAQNWYEVELLMARAEKIKTDDPIQQYLKAVYMNQTGQPENAIEILLNIIDQNYEEPIIYLTLSDIYYYKMNNIPEALKYMEDYLRLESDRVVQKRYDSMKSEITVQD